MKLKLISNITVAIILLLGVVQSASAFTVLGNNPFRQPPLTSVEEMKTVLLDKQADVNDGLKKAGLPELFEPLMAQLPEAQVASVEYQQGQIFKWMFYRKKGVGPVRVEKDAVWESPGPMTSYQFHIDHDGQRYVFAVPPICTNLALLYVAPTPIMPPPPVVTEPPGKAASDSGAGNPGSGVGPQVDVADPLRIPFVFDLGYLHQLDPAHHILLRGGVEFPIHERFSILGLAGFYPKYAGMDSDNSMSFDVLANYTVSRVFFGIGLGAWLQTGDDDNKAEDNDIDLIVNFGSRIIGQADSFNTSVFIEIRGGIDELEDIGTYGRIGAGLRFRF